VALTYNNKFIFSIKHKDILLFNLSFNLLANQLNDKISLCLTEKNKIIIFFQFSSNAVQYVYFVPEVHIRSAHQSYFLC